jgi:hypothetical protein
MTLITRCALVLIVPGMLLGCATAAQRQLAGMAATGPSAMDRYQECVGAIYVAPELEPLRKYLPLNVATANIEYFTNPNPVSEVQRRLIIANHPKYQACRDILVSEFSQTMPTLGSILVKMQTSNDSHLIEFLNKKLTWGEFLQKVKATTIAGNAEIQAESRQMLAALQQSHEAELAHRQAAIQAFGNALAEYGRTQAAIANMNRPVNCTAFTSPRPVSTAPEITNINCY